MSAGTVPITVMYTSPANTRWRNKPQSKSMSSGIMFFTAGGMHLALGLGWNLFTYIPTTQHFRLSWFIGVCIGAILAPAFIRLLHKRFFMLFSGILILIAGILYTSAPTNYDAILAARYLNGIGIGVATIAFIVHGGEIAGRGYRGTCLGGEQYAVTFGIAIQVIFSSEWSYYIGFDVNRVNGIFCIVCALCGIAAVVSIIESPIFWIRKGNDDLALDCLSRLYCPPIITNDTRAQLEEMKVYVQENRNVGFLASLGQSISPLFQIIIYRGMVAFSFSLPMSLILIFSTALSQGEFVTWPLYVAVILRVFGGIIVLVLHDNIGRKAISLFALLCMAGFILGVGGIFNNYLTQYSLSVVCTLLLIFQFFAGMFTPSSSIYLGEAFPLLVKPYSIALCIIIEQIVHIIVITSFQFLYDIFSYCISIGIIMAVFFFVFCVTLPETRCTNLREAQSRFRSLSNMKVY